MVTELGRSGDLPDDRMRERDGSGTGWERCYTLWLSWAEKENAYLFGLLVFTGTQKMLNLLPSFMKLSPLPPFFLQVAMILFWKKIYKDWKLLNCRVFTLGLRVLTLSETLNFNDNIQNLEDIFWPFCFSFLFWKCRDILAGLVSPWCYVILWHQHRYIQLWHVILSGRRKKGRWLSLWSGHDS